MFLATRNPSVCKITRTVATRTVLNDGKFYTFDNGINTVPPTGIADTDLGSLYFANTDGFGSSYTTTSQINNATKSSSICRSGLMNIWGVSSNAYGYQLSLNIAYGQPSTGIIKLTQCIYNDSDSTITPKLCFSSLPTSRGINLSEGGINIDWFGSRAFSFVTSKDYYCYIGGEYLYYDHPYDRAAYASTVSIPPRTAATSIISVCATGFINYYIYGDMTITMTT